MKNVRDLASGPGPRRRAGAMKAGCIAALAVLLLLVLGLGGCGVKSYNSFVTLEEDVAAKWGQVDNMYKRRYELVPNLVAVVRESADFEQSTLQAVTDARASVGRVQLPPGAPGDAQQLEQYLEAQQALGGALSRLLIVAENYPQLRTTEAFRDLASQVEGAQNRINVALTDYIESVQRYNATIRRFPANLLAGLFGKEPMPQYSASEAERANPDVGAEFDR